MLHTILLTAGKWNFIAKSARHINIVSCTGTVRLVMTSETGHTVETDVVSGMAFPALDKLERVDLLSADNQQFKVWVGMTPLAFSPSENRLVGSNSVVSDSGEVFSGQRVELLPERFGRNKVSMIAESDFIIGDHTLSESTGIKISAGQLFSLNTQGAIYGMADGNGYPGVKTTKASSDDVANADAQDGSSNLRALVPNLTGSEYLSLTAGTDDYSRYSVIDNSYLGQINGDFPGNNFVNVVRVVGEEMAVSSWNQLRYVDLNNYTQRKEDITPATGEECEFFDINGRYKVTVDRNNNVYYAVDDGEWVKCTATTGQTGAVYGITVDGDGNLFVAYANTVQVSEDMGGTWQAKGVPGSVDGSDSIFCNQKRGKVFLKAGSFLYSSIDGADSWQQIQGTYQFSILDVVGDTVLIAGTDKVHVSFDAGGTWYVYDYQHLTGSRSVADVCIGHNGTLRVVLNNNKHIVITGQAELQNGLIVKTLSEVN